MTTTPVNKAAIIRSVLEAMKVDLSKDYDGDKITEASVARLNQLSPAHRGDVTITKPDVHKAISFLRRKQGIKVGQNGKAASPKKVTPPKVAPPPPASFTHDELITARRLLSMCGDSLHRAHGALKLVADLTLVKES